ncbi:SDR family NAD(P)-dependent oxidoreductase [Pseudonocardia dioxanivorans]|uniref:SDR family NAD(P)-dependent oxidoreductase n=1 Tax=Pseudonocardia dioxanivorans TaxID=240495 RepID=UPI0013149403
MEQRSQVVLVTGAARGIGLALARGFLAAGDAVVAADRDWAGAPGAAAELESAGNALVTGIDITDAVAVDAAVGAALDRYGRLDVCVNNVALRQRDLFRGPRARPDRGQRRLPGPDAHDRVRRDGHRPRGDGVRQRTDAASRARRAGNRAPGCVPSAQRRHRLRRAGPGLERAQRLRRRDPLARRRARPG